ncbi:MAG: zinc ribbon domain-containing protein [Solirubrobacteraceae bacterium]
MPIYEYRCSKGHTFEVTQRMSDDPVASCETCGAPVERVFHPVAVHFKGKGFYNTDYGTRKRQREMKDSGKGDGAKAGDSGSGDSGSSSSDGKAKAESKKPDAKKEAKKASSGGS